jgi:cytoskeletal protein CcmA (bactofilin family)
MFSRNSEKLESLIGMNSFFKGEIDTKGTIRIDGSLTGNVKADWVILGERAVLKGDITARGIVIGGRVDGNLIAQEIVEIKPKGQVFGDISTKKLTIMEGGFFEGKSTMIREDSKVVEFNIKSV